MNKKQSYPAFYLSMIHYMIISLVIRAIAFAPLAALLLCSGAMKAIALLCPILVVTLVLPRRFSFADALVQDSSKERYFDLTKALSFDNYLEKLRLSLLHAVKVALWGIPMFALVAYFYHLYVGVDIMTLLAMLKKAGMLLIEPGKCIANFFRGIFGQPALEYANVNSMAEGITVVMLLIGIAGLIWLFGACLNSPYRYLWAMSKHGNTSLKETVKNQLQGRFWKRVAAMLINLALVLPFLLVSWFLAKDTITDLSKNLINYMVSRSLPIAELAKLEVPLGVSFLLLYFVLIPARRYLTCRFATMSQRHRAPAAKKGKKQ